MSTPTTTRSWILNSYPTGMPKLSGADAHIGLTSSSLPSPIPADHVLLKPLYFSNDPVQRWWIDSNPPTPLLPFRSGLGKPVPGASLCQVIASNYDALRKGDHAVAYTGWVEYAVSPASMCEKVEQLPQGLSYSHYLGTMGLTGITAYAGIVEVAEAKPSDVVVVSGAAGATGNVVVQIAKHIIGCRRVIGLAGSEEKCKWVESIGADVCYNYKDPTLSEQLKADEQATVYFDNVGGQILETMIYVMADHGRIASCGSISDYNAGEGGVGIRNYFWLIIKSIQMRGFTAFDLQEDKGRMREIFKQKVEEGKFRMGEQTETVVDATFEDVPAVWMRLFEGANTGKLVTRLVT
ncbi:MAG: hypothetical protein M1828_007322 [Chrysothrix sp. TS-e1954]|nr:MAG: hypothetical protein M1828_007322 [Chrysothrix sp. TS-e1954]